MLHMPCLSPHTLPPGSQGGGFPQAEFIQPARATGEAPELALLLAASISGLLSSTLPQLSLLHFLLRHCCGLCLLVPPTKTSHVQRWSFQKAAGL